MVYDPLQDLLLRLGFTWWSIWPIYGFSFIALNFIMILIGRNKIELKNYLSDSVGIFLWPFLLLGPISGFYLVVAMNGKIINERLMDFGFSYESISLKLNKSPNIFWFIALVSVVIVIVTTRRRSHENRPIRKWLLSKNHSLVMTLFFDFPLSVMIITTVIRLIDQWIVLFNFLTSDWLPVAFLHTDELYGLKWLHTIIVWQIVITILISLSPAIMLFREGGRSYSWEYKILLIVGFVIMVLPVGYISILFNSLLGIINNHFLEKFLFSFEVINPSVEISSTDNLLGQLLVTNYVMLVIDTPSSFPVPNWLGGLILFRILVFVYDNFFKTPNSRPAIVDLFNKAIELFVRQ